ncbi:hypothetical protein CDD83_3326 [Cordyceps sp. RAO-2017]|nr:hypothetical protein CDD83_3326 [Cordyceps sp. RAO-2017]
MDRDPEAGSSPPPPPNPVRSSSPPSGCRSRSGSGSRSPSHTPSPSSGSRSPSSSRLDARPDRRLDYRPKRSSATCATCRTRKVRCNGARPLCSNCQRLGFPCSYGDDAAAAADAARPDSCHAVPRRRVKRACLTCHARKARCSGHLPACDRCRAQGLECVYRPGKRTARASARPAGPDVRSPRSHASAADDGCLDSDAALPDRDDLTTCLDESFEALIGRTFDHFFRHVHHIPMYSFLHRASLMAQHAAGKVDRSLLLALVGITSCLTDMGPAVREYGDRCVDEAEALVLADYTRPSTFKLQALVFIVKHRILSNKFASAFFLFSIASRFAVALRLNHDNPALCFLAQESRRRLMWALYCIDSGIANGHRDCALWRADRIHVRLPCNERNFEFDLPQPADRLVAGPDEPPPPPRHAEDVGSLALHVRIFHIRQRIVDFVRDALVSPDLGPADLEAALLSPRTRSGCAPTRRASASSS